MLNNDYKTGSLARVSYQLSNFANMVGEVTHVDRDTAGRPLRVTVQIVSGDGPDNGDGAWWDVVFAASDLTPTDRYR